MKKILPLFILIILLFQTGCGSASIISSSDNLDTGTMKRPPRTEKIPTLETQTVQLKNGIKFNVSLPSGYTISPAAEGYRNLRFMAWSPDNRLFVTEMYSRGDTKLGRLLIFENFNEQTKQFGKVTTYLDKLRNPNSVAFYTDATGIPWLYFALTDKLVRYKYTPGEMKPANEAETLATFPDYGLSYKYGGWHLTRTVVIFNDKVYVSVGSSCNSCEEKEAIRASIIQMDVDGKNQETIASGLRNAVGLTAVEGKLYVTNMGADHLGNDKPEDTFYAIEEGKNYGWPYCYQYQNKMYTDNSQKWKKQFDCTEVPLASGVFAAHSAPLGLRYFSPQQNLPYLNNTFLVALHGSGTASLEKGYKVVRTTPNESVEDFITGFIQKGKIYGRPVDIISYNTKGFFMTDDHTGTLYYVYR